MFPLLTDLAFTRRCNIILRCERRMVRDKLSEGYTRYVLIIPSILCLLLASGCRTDKIHESIEGLPDLPPPIAQTLDPQTLATKAPLVNLPILQPFDDPARCPPCGSKVVTQLQVNYLYTRCGSYRDILSPPASSVEFRGDQINLKRYRLKELNGQRFSDIQVCISSQGPWNALLTESRACSGTCALSHELVISAFNNLIKFEWIGEVEDHPTDVQVLSCRRVSRHRTPCGMSGQCCTTPGECYGQCTQNCVCSVPW